MPRGPNGERRPADAIGCAVAVARIATGEDEAGTIRPTSDRRKTGKAGGEVARVCPANELKEPVKKFADTFSAETIMLETFFPEKIKA